MTTIFVKEGTVLPERHANDKYVTEATLIHAALQRYRPALTSYRPVHSILDIGAGDGRWAQIAFSYHMGAKIVAGVEIEDQPHPPLLTHWYPNQDYMTWECPFTNLYGRGVDLAVANPPFFLSEEIIRKAWTELNPGGMMIMLLRLAFMEGIGRYNGLWNEIWPSKVGVLSRRPSFYGAGKTNGTTHGLFVWEKDNNGNPVGSPRSWQTELVYYEREKERK